MYACIYILLGSHPELSHAQSDYVGDRMEIVENERDTRPLRHWRGGDSLSHRSCRWIYICNTRMTNPVFN